MKLTVCFGDTKVVVPCGSGNLTVRDLTLSGLKRVRHTLPKLGPQDRIVVHSINVARDGGMLDWDDLVCDVLDDREMVTAHFSIATLACNASDSCPVRSSAGVDSIFQSLSTPLVVDLCADNATGSAFRNTLQSNGAEGSADNRTSFASACGSGLGQTDTNCHITSRLLRIGDGSTSSSNLSLNLSNDSCGMNQTAGIHTSQFSYDHHEWFPNNGSSKDSSSRVHSNNNNLNCITTSYDSRKQCFTSPIPCSTPQPLSICCNVLPSECEHVKSQLVSCNVLCPNGDVIDDNSNNTGDEKYQPKTTLKSNVFEMLSNALSRRRDLIESGWDSDEEDEDVGDPDGGYSYDSQVGEQQNEILLLSKTDAVNHSDVINASYDLTPASSLKENCCSESIVASNSRLHEDTNDGFSTVRRLSVSSASNKTRETLSARPISSNNDIWPLPPPPFCATDGEHGDMSSNPNRRLHSPEDEYHIGINTERLIRAVQNHSSFSSLSEFSLSSSNSEPSNCTSVCALQSSLPISSPQIPHLLSYSQPSLGTPREEATEQQNTQDTFLTHSIVSNVVHQPGTDIPSNPLQFHSPHVVSNANSAKSLIMPSRPASLSCSRSTTRLGAVFQSTLTVPTIVEEEEEYSIDSERFLNVCGSKTEHQCVDGLLHSTDTQPLLNDTPDINDTVEEDYPLLRKDYILEKDQKISDKHFDALHVNTTGEYSINSSKVYLSDFQVHADDNPVITHRTSRGLPKPDVLRWLEDTRDATVNCKVNNNSNLSHLSSSLSSNHSDFILDDQQKREESKQQKHSKSEEVSFTVVETPPPIDKSQESLDSKDTVIIRLVNTKRGENLGIQIKPVFSEVMDLNNSDSYSDENTGSRMECGLEVHSIIPHGRVDREQCLSVGDRILSINGISLSGIPFEKGRDIFQAALNEPEILLRVLPLSAYQHSPPVSVQSTDNTQNTEKSDKPSCGLIVVVSDLTSKGKESEAKCNISQLKPVPPPPPRRSPNTVLTRIPEGIIKPLIDEFLQEKKQREEEEERQQTQLKNAQPPSYDDSHRSTQSINRSQSDNHLQFTCHTIRLCKGSSGLGFSLTSCDANPSSTGDSVSNQKVICVKNILPGGAALTDGQLKPGDLLIKVDDIYVNEIGQARTVALLRSKPVNTIVTLVVSRPEQPDFNPQNINSNENSTSHTCMPDLKIIPPSVVCTISSSCCLNTANTSAIPNEQLSKLAAVSLVCESTSGSSSVSSHSQPTMQQQNGKVIVEQPSSYTAKLPYKLSECSCSSHDDTSQEFHPLQPSHPSYKLHGVDSSQWSLYLLDIHLPLTRSTETDKSVTLQSTESIVHQPQSIVKRQTGNPATLGVSVSVRRLTSNHRGGGDDGKQADQKTDDSLGSQSNAVFVRTVIDGGPAYQDGRLQVGDRLLTIDGQPLSGLSTSDALNRLKSVIAQDLNECHPCVRLLIARARRTTPSDDSYTNPIEEHSTNRIINPVQHKSSSEVAKKEQCHNRGEDQSKLLIVSAIVHSSESISTGNINDVFDSNTKCSLPLNTCTSTGSSSKSQQQQQKSHPTTSHLVCTDQISQATKEGSKSPQSRSGVCSNPTDNNISGGGGGIGSHKNILKTSSMSCSTTKGLCQTSNNDSNSPLATTTDADNHHNNTHHDSKRAKKRDGDYCALRNVRKPMTCLPHKHLNFGYTSDTKSCTPAHNSNNYQSHNTDTRISSKSKYCYNNNELDQNDKKRMSNYSSSSTEMIYNYQNLSHLQSSFDDCGDGNDSLYQYHYLPTDDSDLNYDATLSDPETERQYYKLDSLSDSNLSSISGKMITPTMDGDRSRSKFTSRTCNKHCKYSSNNKCKYRVVYRQPRIDFSQMVLVPFDPSAWNGPVLKPRTALNPEELKLLDIPKKVDSLGVDSHLGSGGDCGGSISSNNTLIPDSNCVYDESVERREDNKMVIGQKFSSSKDQNCISDSDDGYSNSKQNPKCSNTESGRLRKTPHPKTVISKLFSLVKTTTHRRIGDQNVTTDSEQVAGWQPSPDSFQIRTPGEHINPLMRNKSINQNSCPSDNSGKNLTKPQSYLPTDLQHSTNDRMAVTAANPVEKSALPVISPPSCYATLHERVEPSMHIYDTANNIQGSSNDNRSDEQVKLDVKYSSQTIKLSPHTDIREIKSTPLTPPTTTGALIINNPGGMIL
ncbi:unnamed protein product [Heterobilharzia americana]|nr:unnamed protein product [Heterobilharzia americana]